MIDHPFETKSDSFYFVNGKLIMHNKASYKVYWVHVLSSYVPCLYLQECFCYLYNSFASIANFNSILNLSLILLFSNLQYIREDSTAGVKKSYEDKFSAKVHYSVQCNFLTHFERQRILLSN